MLRIVSFSLALFVTFLSHAAEPEPFVVHEWGVWIRTRANVFNASPGGKMLTVAQKSDVRSVLGPPAELNDELPEFVLQHASAYTPRQEARNWRKPVIHFYGPDNLNVTVHISTPFGSPFAYWPKPAFTERTNWTMGSGVTEATGLSWSGRLVAAAPAQLKAVKDNHWWKRLRDIPSKYIETADGAERFLFYEATAVQEQPVRATLGETALLLKNTGKAESGAVVVIVNDGSSRHCLAVKSIPAGNSVTLERAAIEAASGAEDAVLKTCREQWESFGMTPEESRGIVAAWQPDLLTKAGFLVISHMPRESYDIMFPLTITPEPAKCVRVGLVFDTLPGESARLAWLPALRAQVETASKDLSSDDFDVRAAAVKRVAQFGDIAAPLIQDLANSHDAGLSGMAKEILSKWDLPQIILQQPDPQLGAHSDEPRGK